MPRTVCGMRRCRREGVQDLDVIETSQLSEADAVEDIPDCLENALRLGHNERGTFQTPFANLSPHDICKPSLRGRVQVRLARF